MTIFEEMAEKLGITTNEYELQATDDLGTILIVPKRGPIAGTIEFFYTFEEDNYNTICSKCGSKAYQGFIAFECSKCGG